MLKKTVLWMIASAILGFGVLGCSSGKREATPTDQGQPPKCLVIETYDTDWVGNRINKRFDTYCLQEK